VWVAGWGRTGLNIESKDKSGTPDRNQSDGGDDREKQKRREGKQGVEDSRGGGHRFERSCKTRGNVETWESTEGGQWCFTGAKKDMRIKSEMKGPKEKNHRRTQEAWQSTKHAPRGKVAGGCKQH